jgi:hypothetical protein
VVFAAIPFLIFGHFARVRGPKSGAKSLVGDLFHIVTKGVSSTDLPAKRGRYLLMLVQRWCSVRVPYLNDDVLHPFEEVAISWNHCKALQVTRHSHQHVRQCHVSEHVLRDLE